VQIIAAFIFAIFFGCRVSGEKNGKIYSYSSGYTSFWFANINCRSNNIISAKELITVHLQESGEMYLETIHILSQRGKGVRAVDVAEYMGFSKPSVSRAVGLLRTGGYLELDANGFLVLTDEGKYIANRTYERHLFFTDFFTSLGVSRETAEDDACKIEHDISDETFQAMKRYVQAQREKE